MEGADDNNNMKWASIPLTIPTLCRMPKEKLNQAIFETSVFATIKFDGTNVGRDETGLMYGRNKTIKAGTKAYQKAPLANVEKIDTVAIKKELLAQTGISEDAIQTIVVYGELMCNKGLYRYDEDNLFGTCPILGAMLKPKNKEAIA